MANLTPSVTSAMFDDAVKLLYLEAASEGTISEELLKILLPPTPTPPPQRGGDSLLRSRRIRRFSTPKNLDVRLYNLFILMTRDEEVSAFEDMITSSNQKELTSMASLLTSKSDYFMMIIKDMNGSKNIHKLLGKSDDVDVLISQAIMRHFLQVMTHEHASHVAIQGMRVFDIRKKKLMYESLLQHALHLARDQYGYIAFNEIITFVDDPHYRKKLLDFVTNNALLLSKHSYANLVVKHVLNLHDSRCTFEIAVNLRGHCVELAFQKYGSEIVKQLLFKHESVMEIVVEDLLECEDERLMRLARSEFGIIVVENAMLVTRDIFTARLHVGLVNKLIPFRHHLRDSPARNIATTLDSVFQSRIKFPTS